MRIGGHTPSGHPRYAAPAVAPGWAAPIAVAIAVVVLAASACGPSPRVGAPRPAAPVTSATFTHVAQDILVPRCATSACHAGSPPPAEPTLDADLAWSALVGVPSQQASGLNLVEPFAPERSYLVMKLRGTASNAGGIATAMPIGDSGLDETDIAAIEAWIANGAQND